MTDPARNGYDDDDLKAIIYDIEGFIDEKASVMGAAMEKCSRLSKKIADAKKTAKSLNIPTAPLNALLKTRKLQRKLDEIAKDIDEDYVEVFEDMVGQLSWLAPVEDEPPVETKAKTAASRRQKSIDATTKAEIAEGEKVLETVQ